MLHSSHSVLPTIKINTDETQSPFGTGLETERLQQPALTVRRQPVQGKNASQQTSLAMSMQASQVRTILPLAVLLWLHQVTVSQDSVLEDAREGQWHRHSLWHNTSRLHAALPCTPANRQPPTTQAELHGQTTCLCRQAVTTNCRKLSYICSLADNSLLPCHPCWHSCADRMRLQRQCNMHSLSVQPMTCFV